MLNAFFVGLGGFVGSIGRYLLINFSKRLSAGHWFPIGTLTVNIAGCFLIGILGGYLQDRSDIAEHWRLFVIVGVLGGFTTFSTFGHETVHLVKSTQSLGALLNIILHVSLCLFAAWWGHHLGR